MASGTSKSGQYEPVDAGGASVEPSEVVAEQSTFSEGRKPIRQRVLDWIYPPEAPQATQLWRVENIAIPLGYCMVGLLQGLGSGVMAVYPIEIGATEAQQTSIKLIQSLPASLKILFGFLSDTVPLFGFRRKGYMLTGWMLSSASMFTLLALGVPSIPLLALLYFWYGLGFWLADVIADSLVAEKAKLEPEGQKGKLQSTCYACRFFMLMVGAAFATYAYDALSPRFMFWVMGLAPVAICVPATYLLAERRYADVPSVKAQSLEIWSSVTSRSVWQPMAFIYVYNLLQIGNAAWTQFLYTRLKFSATMINSLMVVAKVMLYFGIMIYKYGMMAWSWRLVYIFTTLLNAVFSTLQVVLVFGWNQKVGVSNFLFALGDDAIADFIAGIQFLPSSIMFVNLCPVGSEGASYAMFTTASNTALGVGSSLSTLLLGIWDVSKQALESGQVYGMAKLTVLTTLLQTSGLLFVFLLPRNRDELLALSHRGRSRVAGAIFLAAVGLGILFSIVDTLLNVLVPGWSGES
ncbi:hypothetical protein NDN08_008388 [Rhodosorus marinus]|uniref:Uncharacterized protein n=1 Tax=Rhodosorus marinus TaxID=101924 RepID=A0AAV8V3J9_9RHOD|nr:hypothetical protein NDN08_008388 [Rhodosorus marinus]